MSAVAPEILPMEQFQAHHTVWDGIAETPQFRRLTAAKKTFIIPVLIFFVAYILALPVLDGYAPQFMSTKVIGMVSRAYLFALSQFFVTWAVAAWYTRTAAKFDLMAKEIVAQAEEQKGGR